MRLNSFDRLGSNTLQLGKRRARSRQGCHLRLDLLTFFFFALDIHIPADQLAGEADILAFLADGERKLCVFHDDFKVTCLWIDDLNARHLGRR